MASGFFFVVSLFFAVTAIGSLAGLIAIIAAIAWVIVILQMSVAESAGCFFAGFAIGTGAALEIICTFPGAGTLVGLLLAWSSGTDSDQIQPCIF